MTTFMLFWVYVAVLFLAIDTFGGMYKDWRRS